MAYNITTPDFGDTLTSDSPNGTVISYRWEIRAVTTAGGQPAGLAPITGATSSSYTIPANGIINGQRVYYGTQIRLVWTELTDTFRNIEHNEPFITITNPPRELEAAFTLPVAGFTGEVSVVPPSEFGAFTYALGTPSNKGANVLNWVVKVPLAVFLTDGTQQMAIRRLRLTREGNDVDVFFNLQPWSGTDIISGGDMHDFLASIEEDTEAFIISDGTNSAILPGPNSADANPKDPTDRYNYTVVGDAATDILTLMSNHGNGFGADSQITINRPRPERDLEGTLSLPAAGFSGSVSVDQPRPAGNFNLVGDISLPVPTFSGSVDVMVPTLLEGSLSLPVSNFTGSISTEIVPEATFTLPVAKFTGAITIDAPEIASISATVNLGNSTFNSAFLLQWVRNVNIPSSLIKDPTAGVQYQITYFELIDNSTNVTVVVNLNQGEFLDLIEVNPSAFTLSDGTNTVVVPGPNSSGIVGRGDPTEPYSYNVPVGQLVSFMQSFAGDTSRTLTLTIWNGVSRISLVGTLTLPVVDVDASIQLFHALDIGGATLTLPVATFTGEIDIGALAPAEGTLSLPVVTFTGSIETEVTPVGTLTLPVATFTGETTQRSVTPLAATLSLPLVDFTGFITHTSEIELESTPLTLPVAQFSGTIEHGLDLDIGGGALTLPVAAFSGSIDIAYLQSILATFTLPVADFEGSAVSYDVTNIDVVAGRDVRVTSGETVQLRPPANLEPVDPDQPRFFQSGKTYRWKQVSGPPVSLFNPNSETPIFIAPDIPRENDSGRFSPGARGRVTIPDEGIDDIYKIQERADTLDGRIVLNMIRDLDAAYEKDEERLDIHPIDYVPVFTAQIPTGLIFEERESPGNDEKYDVLLSWTNPARNTGARLIIKIVRKDQMVTLPNMVDVVLDGNNYLVRNLDEGDVLNVRLYGRLDDDESGGYLGATYIVGTGATYKITGSILSDIIIQYGSNYLTIWMAYPGNTNSLEFRFQRGRTGSIDTAAFEALPVLAVKAVPLHTHDGHVKSVFLVNAWYSDTNNRMVNLNGENTIYIRPSGPGGHGSIAHGFVNIIREIRETVVNFYDEAAEGWLGTKTNLAIYPEDYGDILLVSSRRAGSGMTKGQWDSLSANVYAFTRVTTGNAVYTTPWRNVDDSDSYVEHDFTLLLDIEDLLTNAINDSYTWTVEYEDDEGNTTTTSSMSASDFVYPHEGKIKRWRIAVTIDLTSLSNSWYFRSMQIETVHKGVEARGPGGLGFEFIYATTAEGSTPSNPDNNWGFDTPGIHHDGTGTKSTEWFDAAPDLTEAKPCLWQSIRQVKGVPRVGSEIDSKWTAPALIGKLGIDGEAGEDGRGFEFIYAITSNTTAPASPDNDWGYDTPGINHDGTGTKSTTWFDGAPDTSTTTPFLWLCTRKVPGGTATGGEVTDNWTDPVIIGHFGIDGIDGEDGDPGADSVNPEGDPIYAATSARISPSLPDNDWGYQEPSSPWTTVYPELSLANRYIWRATREVIGNPAVGDEITGNWRPPKVVAIFGQGTPGERGPGFYFVSISAAEQAILETQDPLTNQSLINKANTAVGGTPRGGDFVSFTRGSGATAWAKVYVWSVSQSRWNGSLPFIGAQEVAAVHLYAVTGDFSDLKVTGVLEAGHLSADVKNITPLYKGSYQLSESSNITSAPSNPSTFTFLNIDLTDFDHLEFVLRDSQQWYGSASIPVSVLTQGTWKQVAAFGWEDHRTRFRVRRDSATQISAHTTTAGDDNSIWILEIDGVKGPANNGTAGGGTGGGATTTNTDVIYIRASSKPSNPSGGTNSFAHLPSGWSRINPGPTTALDVWRATRTRRFNSATRNSTTFTSATGWVVDSSAFQARNQSPLVAPPTSVTVNLGGFDGDGNRIVSATVVPSTPQGYTLELGTRGDNGGGWSPWGAYFTKAVTSKIKFQYRARFRRISDNKVTGWVLSNIVDP